MTKQQCEHNNWCRRGNNSWWWQFSLAYARTKQNRDNVNGNNWACSMSWCSDNVITSYAITTESDISFLGPMRSQQVLPWTVVCWPALQDFSVSFVFVLFWFSRVLLVGCVVCGISWLFVCSLLVCARSGFLVFKHLYVFAGFCFVCVVLCCLGVCGCLLSVLTVFLFDGVHLYFYCPVCCLTLCDRICHFTHRPHAWLVTFHIDSARLAEWPL